MNFCENLFLRIVGKIARIAEIRTRKNFVPHGTQKANLQAYIIVLA